MKRFLWFTDSDPAEPVPESDSGTSSGTDSGPDYNQMIYEYLVSQDILSGTRQEEMFSTYSDKIDSLESQLQDIHTAIEWNMSLLLIMFVLYLFRSVRRWVYKLTGGMNDVS